MKHTYYLAAFALGIALIIPSVTPSSVQAAGLSESQIQAIVTLVKTFGVDANIVTNVENALRGVAREVKQEEKKPDQWGVVHIVGNETAWRHAVCKRILAGEALAERGDFVRELQEFLSGEGFFGAGATGYFGPITREALGKWQAQYGIVNPGDLTAGWGVFGPKTREHIKQWCGWGGGEKSERFSASPERGAVPLAVTFSTWLSGFRPQSVSFLIDFGDGTSERAADCLAPADACIEPGKNTHTYMADGTYIATLSKVTDICAGVTGCMAPVSTEVIAKKEIYVGTTACTKEYKPVCGQPPWVCPAGHFCAMMMPAPKTYSNACFMKVAGATLVYEGACRTTDIVACTADAKQCPDGSYVGRTGLKCEFVCPSSTTNQ